MFDRSAHFGSVRDRVASRVCDVLAVSWGNLVLRGWELFEIYLRIVIERRQLKSGSERRGWDGDRDLRLLQLLRIPRHMVSACPYNASICFVSRRR